MSGYGGRGRGTQGGGNPRVCRFIAQGTCRDGDRCRYSHPAAQEPSATPDPPAPRPSAHDNDRRLREWKDIIKRTGRLGMTLITDKPKRKIFNLGLELMDLGIETTQEVINDLGKDVGLGFIRDLIDT